MAKHTYYTHLKSLRKKLLKWILIIGGIFLVATQVIFYIETFDPLYLAGVALGLWILAQGLFFKYFMRRVILTLEDRYIEYYHFRTILFPEQTKNILWSAVSEVILTNYNIRLTCKDGKKIKLKLPHYNQTQFGGITTRLQELAEVNGAVFKIRRWQ